MLDSDNIHVQFLVSSMQYIYKKNGQIFVQNDTYHISNAQLCG